MLKLLGSILVIGASAALGLALRQQAVVHVRALTEWIDCLNLLLLEIGGQCTPLHEAFLAVARSRNRTVAPFFLELTKRMSGMPDCDFRAMWRDAVGRYAAEWGLRPEEADLLTGVGDFLGRYDGAAQTHSLQTVMLRLTERRDEAAFDLRTRNSLYRTCGAAAGILLVLVFI